VAKKKVKLAPTYVFPTQAHFDTAAIVRAMNANAADEMLLGEAAEVEQVVVVGQLSAEPITPETPEGAEDALRVLIVYRQVATNILGVLAHDMTATLLRLLEQKGALE
jgi:hypothetical protein